MWDNTYRGINLSFWLTFEVVELFFQPTGEMFECFCNLEALLPGNEHLFFNSLQTGTDGQRWRERGRVRGRY